MARQTITKLIDDIDGSPADTTVTFALDGERFEIDLSDANAAQMRESLAPWIAGARPLRGRATGRPGAGAARRSRSGAPSEAQAIREWARENNIEVSDRGRIKAEIVEMYNNR